MSPHCSYAATVTCDECPWRKNAAPGRFAPERYVALAGTSKQGFGAIFTCHKTDDGNEHACVGWLMVDGPENLVVRFAIAKGDIDFKNLRSRGELYDSYGEMAEANGVSAEQVDELGVRSERRERALSEPVLD